MSQFSEGFEQEVYDLKQELANWQAAYYRLYDIMDVGYNSHPTPAKTIWEKADFRAKCLRDGHNTLMSIYGDWAALFLKSEEGKKYAKRVG